MKFVKAINQYSLLFSFDEVVTAGRRFYLPELSWLQHREFYALTIADPLKTPSIISWGGRDYNYITEEQSRQFNFTLNDREERAIIKDGIPRDFIKDVNDGQVRVYDFQNVWTGGSWVTPLENQVVPFSFTPNTAIIFQFWYK